jgi:hypothetical protein
LRRGDTLLLPAGLAATELRPLARSILLVAFLP